MKRKPDAMIALIAIFCLGLAISGFASMSSNSGKAFAANKQTVEFSASRY